MDGEENLYMHLKEKNVFCYCVLLKRFFCYETDYGKHLIRKNGKSRFFANPINTFLMITVLILCCIVPQQAFSETQSEIQFRIAVFTPITEDNTYWPEVHRIMNSAAKDLGIKLSIHEFDVRDRFAKSEAGVEILQREPKPDAAIFSVAFGQAVPLMDAAEELDIPFFLNGPLFPTEMEKLGGTPRQSYKNWIGYFQEDEELKGYLLAQQLIKSAINNNYIARDGTFHIVGIGGDTTWYGSIIRERGLFKAVEKEPRARLLQTVPTRWTPDEGREMTTRLLERHPEVRVVWAASDQLGLGAAEALRSLGMEPGYSAFTGGLDLSKIGLEAVKKGDLQATVACTPLIWAETLIYLYDYLQGKDFAELIGTEIIFQPEIATQSKAEELLMLREKYEKIDFRKYSRYYNNNDAYNLDIR